MKRSAFLLTTLLSCCICFAGAWGADSFSNDDALDWLNRCIESKDSKVVASALNTAIHSNSLEASDGAAAVAAAEVVAAAAGKPGKPLPKELDDWLKHQPKQELAKFAPVARKALVRVKDARVSELAQLWQESSDRQWDSTIAELEKRLK